MSFPEFPNFISLGDFGEVVKSIEVPEISDDLYQDLPSRYVILFSSWVCFLLMLEYFL